MTKKSPEEIYEEYRKAIGYNVSLGLYDTVRQNENFYLGRQWEGLNAPDLDKPVLNFLKRVCSYIVAMLVSDDISVQLTPFADTDDNRRMCRVLENELQRVLERTKAKSLCRQVLRDCVVDGDGCFFAYFDALAPTAQTAKGEIALELVENTKILFGNPYVADVQKQPYILIVRRQQLESVRARARQCGSRDAELICADCDAGLYEENDLENSLVTVITKLYKHDGTVRFSETTRSAIVRADTDTGYALYPVAYMSFERVRNSYHGQAPISGLIPNQIAVNKLWAMAIRHQHMLAFPKVFYDRRKISEWSNRVGEAIGVAGNPNEAVASSFRAADMSNQLIAIVERTIDYTKEFLGASDAALGNVDPQNTSAILAVQKAAAAPLELQRLAFFQFVEELVLVLLDIIRVNYGVRSVALDGRLTTFDFAAVDYGALSLNVEVGSTAYWSELMQLQTLDNMFSKGVIDDALIYLEAMPDRYVKNKRELLGRIRAHRAAQEGEGDGMSKVQM